MTAEESSSRETPASPSGGGDGRLSVLQQLKNRHEEIKQNDYIDLPVPRWSDPEILVRYQAVDHGVIRKGGQEVDKAPARRKPDTEVNANCDVLARACVRVFARIDGEEFSLKPGEPRGDFTKFDRDLAENLGLDPDQSSARQVIRKLFFTDGDILSHAQKVAEFSGYREQEADEGLSGE
jgi:hypothetical protein